MFLKSISIFALISVALAGRSWIQNNDPALISGLVTILNDPETTSVTVVINGGKLLFGVRTIELPSKLGAIAKITQVGNVLVLADSYIASADALKKIEQAVRTHGKVPFMLILTKAIPSVGTVGNNIISTVVNNECVLNNPVGTLRQGGLVNLVIGLLRILSILDTLCGVVDLKIANNVLNNVELIG